MIVEPHQLIPMSYPPASHNTRSSDRVYYDTIQYDAVKTVTHESIVLTTKRLVHWPMIKTQDSWGFLHRKSSEFILALQDILYYTDKLKSGM